jgi:hypothetical protein
MANRADQLIRDLIALLNKHLDHGAHPGVAPAGSGQRPDTIYPVNSAVRSYAAWKLGHRFDRWGDDADNPRVHVLPCLDCGAELRVEEGSAILVYGTVFAAHCPFDKSVIPAREASLRPGDEATKDAGKEVSQKGPTVVLEGGGLATATLSPDGQTITAVNLSDAGAWAR